MSKRQKQERVKAAYKVAEAAALLGVTEQHILNEIDCGALGAIDISGSSKHFWRIPIGELEKYKARRSSQSAGKNAEWLSPKELAAIWGAQRRQEK